MHAGERHLGGADQVLVVRLAQAVDLIGVGVEEAGAAHDLGAHQRGGDGQREAVGLGLVDGHGQHGDLHARHGATQEVEAEPETLAPRRVSMPATSVPSVIWSFGSKPSAAKSRGAPTFLTTT